MDRYTFNNKRAESEAGKRRLRRETTRETMYVVVLTVVELSLYASTKFFYDQNTHTKEHRGAE
eukprot:scaffold249336_cov57-Cyclotella_meneghiniana.AAC.2